MLVYGNLSLSCGLHQAIPKNGVAIWSSYLLDFLCALLLAAAGEAQRFVVDSKPLILVLMAPGTTADVFIWHCVSLIIKLQ